MPSRSENLAQLTAYCRDLFDRRLVALGEKTRVSQAARVEVMELADWLGRFHAADPFPEIDADGELGLATLRQRLTEGEGPEAIGNGPIIAWATPHFSPHSPAPAAAPEFNEASAGNVRMLGNLRTFKTAATRARLRLIKAGDAPAQTAYAKARNAFTMARAAYIARLENNGLVATLEQNLAFEREHLVALTDATGAALPVVIQSAADYCRRQVFGPHTFTV